MHWNCRFDLQKGSWKTSKTPNDWEYANHDGHRSKNRQEYALSNDNPDKCGCSGKFKTRYSDNPSGKSAVKQEESFGEIKQIVARNNLLDYTDFNKQLDIYMGKRNF